MNGDAYEGYFKDGLPHGHGMKKEGHFMASVATVYIGEWSCGVKEGYGVSDDIKTGIDQFERLVLQDKLKILVKNYFLNN